MTKFPKKEINATFLMGMVAALRSDVASWRRDGQRIGLRFNEDLWYLVELSASTSPTQAGFRATVGVGSVGLQRVLPIGSKATMPWIHVGEVYKPTLQPDGLGSPGSDWIVMTRFEHVPMQVRQLSLHALSHKEKWLARCASSDLFISEVRSLGNPLYASILAARRDEDNLE